VTIDTVGTPAEEDRSGFWRTEERWYMCDYCGWWYPKSDTRVEPHTGRRACTTGPDDYNSPSLHDEALIARKNRLLFVKKEEQTE
jgi:hypothetical protein